MVLVLMVQKVVHDLLLLHHHHHLLLHLEDVCCCCYVDLDDVMRRLGPWFVEMGERGKRGEGY